MRLRKPPPAPIMALICLAAAAGVLIIAFVLSQPDDLDRRMSAIRQTIARTNGLNSQPGAPGAFPPGAVCKDAGELASKAYYQRLAGLASTYGVPVTGLVVASPAESAQGALSPVTVRWKGRAGYDGLVSLLAAISLERPVLFVDAFDMKPRQGVIEFDLRGTVWCWTPVNTRS